MLIESWRVILYPGSRAKITLKSGAIFSGTIEGDPSVNAVLRLETPSTVHLIDWGEIAAASVSD